LERSNCLLILDAERNEVHMSNVRNGFDDCEAEHAVRRSRFGRARREETLIKTFCILM
jgi:hypothetical protein